MNDKPWGEGAGELRSLDIVQALRHRAERERAQRAKAEQRKRLIERIKALAQWARAVRET